MKATIAIDKSFTETVNKFSKEIKKGDLENFLKEEGEYLERLAEATREHGESGDGFTVVYTVTVAV